MSAFISLFTEELANQITRGDMFIDMFFAVDILLTFRTEIPMRQGSMCTDSKIIAHSYLRGWFAIDMMASIPFDVIGASFTSAKNQQVCNAAGTILAGLYTPQEISVCVSLMITGLS